MRSVQLRSGGDAGCSGFCDAKRKLNRKPQLPRLAQPLQAQLKTPRRAKSRTKPAAPSAFPKPFIAVVSLAPSITETLYALGLQNELVGDTDYCDYPPDAQHKPKVGGAINPSLEAIAALHPDLVLVTKALNRLDTVRALATLNIPSYATDPHTVTEILSSTQHLADLLGVPDSGVAITSDLQQRLESTQQRLSHFPLRRVLFVVWPQPLISVGKKTFIADALLYAGATSIIDSSQDWPQVSLEEVVHQQPEFLVFAESHSSEAPPGIDSLANLPGWRVLDAVKGRHFALVSDAVNRPALRIVSAIESLAKQLHPEAYRGSARRGTRQCDPARRTFLVATTYRAAIT